MNNTFKKLISVSIAGLIGVSAADQADEKVINLYSARHYS
ncbi:MAG TPA: Fe(3+) ABC transporter substrate-binding protein, partial [Limnobacter sp.]|nr:Fe(3+) ABC transporter substrate-binding protein [Limnobacter sp.]